MKAENKIERLVEFQNLLADYKPSDEALELLKTTRMVLLIGPTAAGRNTLIRILQETGRYHFIVSHTTRNPRDNNGVMEQNGVEYWFNTEQEMLEGLARGEYLEAEIIHSQQVSGTSIDELRRAREASEIPIGEIEPKGASKISKYENNILFIFFLPPNFPVWMERLRSRGQISEEEVRRRLVSAQDEINLALGSDIFQFVINNEIHEAAEAVDQLANGRPLDEAKQAQGRKHAQELLVGIADYLGQ